MTHVRIGPLWLVKTTLLSLVLGSRQLRLPIVRNEIKKLDAICDADSFNVTITLERPFKGMLSAKDFSQECNTFGAMKNAITLNLPTYGCGLRLTTKNNKNGEIIMQYSVTLAIQQDRHLRQIADQEIHVSCQINADEFSFKSKSILSEMETNLLNEGNVRSSRMRQDKTWNAQLEKNKGKNENIMYKNLQSAKAWMEIVPGENRNLDNTIQEKLQVGELAKLIIRSTLPAEIGWKVVDCNAHDGLGDSSQKLLNEEGCPIDDQLMPKPIYGIPEEIQQTRYQEAVAVFPAFKFPDRDRLHLTCIMLLCRGSCIETDCNKNISLETTDRLGKTLTKNNEDNILDQIKIFNSVEVLAPTVNEYYKTREYRKSKE